VANQKKFNVYNLAVDLGTKVVQFLLDQGLLKKVRFLVTILIGSLQEDGN